MRQRLFCSLAAAIVGVGSVLGQQPARLPDGPEPPPIVSGPIATGPLVAPASAPVLLPVPARPTANSSAESTGAVVSDSGNCGLRPGVEFLPNPCDVCTPMPTWYGDLAFMLVWTKNGNNPTPLVTAGTPTNFGIIGAPGPVSVLYGGQDIDYGTFNGLKGTLGYWFDSKSRFGIEGSGFLLERRSEQFSTFGNGDPNGTVVISRPLIDTTLPPPGEDVFVVAQPGVQTGGVVTSSTSRLWGAEGNFVLNARDRRQSRIDLLAGFRYLDLLETLTVNESSALIGTPFATNEVDSFNCRNQFYGGQLGYRWVINRGRWSFANVGKLAMGFTHEAIDRLGSTTFFGFGPAPVTVLGGQLVLPSNYGRDVQDRFSVAPSSSIQLAYQVTRHASAFVGYDFLYISSVVRPGDNIDRTLNPAGLPLPTGPGVVVARPAGGINGTDFYANALTFGLSFTY